MRTIALVIAVACSCLIAATAAAFPDAEVVWSAGGGPPFNFGVSSTYSGFLLTSDRRLVLSYAEQVGLVDLGLFALEADQPPDFSADTTTDGVVTGIAYASAQNTIPVSQDDGDLLFVDLSDPSATPNVLVVVADDKLGPIAVDTNGQYAYVADNTSLQIHVIDLLTQAVVSSLPLVISGVTTFTLTDAVFVELTSEAWFTTDSAALFYVPSGGASATMVDLGVYVTPRISLPALAAFPGGAALYVVDATTPAVVRIDTATHAKVGDSIEILDNSDLTDITVANILNPAGVYAYLAGTRGVNVINTGTNQVLDMGTDPLKGAEPIAMSAEPYVLVPSSDIDGNVYVGFSTGGVGVISERPFVAFTSVAYSGGADTLTNGGSVEITFMADAIGTYELRANGSVDASGTLIVDSTGSSTGTVAAADTGQSLTIPYDANASVFLEGTNDIWIFLTGDAGRGRRAAQITVDTPPPNVVILSTGFGNGRIYANVERLTINDMASYTIYADEDPDAVLTKVDAQGSAAQPSSGSQVAVEASGLTNGVTYYVAVEAVDANGNTSLLRTATLSDGTRATATPQKTVGPAGLSGEKGCSLARAGDAARWAGGCLLLATLLSIAAMRRRVAMLAVVVLVLSMSIAAVAQASAGEVVEESDVPAVRSLLEPQQPWWSFEVKTGFWMPQSSSLDRFFEPCCNLVTRIQGGLLVHRRYGVELGTGFLYKSGSALGEQSGQPSQDHYSFLLIPIELSFVWRADYFDWRYIIPYLKAGFDSWYFRESVAGDSTSGVKFGTHGVGGMQINIGLIGGVDKALADSGVEEMFLTLETQYQWINNFGSSGLDLTGPIFSIGLLFEF